MSLIFTTSTPPEKGVGANRPTIIGKEFVLHVKTLHTAWINNRSLNQKVGLINGELQTLWFILTPFFLSWPLRDGFFNFSTHVTRKRPIRIIWRFMCSQRYPNDRSAITFLSNVPILMTLLVTLWWRGNIFIWFTTCIAQKWLLTVPSVFSMSEWKVCK